MKDICSNPIMQPTTPLEKLGLNVIPLHNLPWQSKETLRSAMSNQKLFVLKEKSSVASSCNKFVKLHQTNVSE